MKTGLHYSFFHESPPLETLGRESLSLYSQYQESLAGRMTEINKHFSKQ